MAKKKTVKKVTKKVAKKVAKKVIKKAMKRAKKSTLSVTKGKFAKVVNVPKVARVLVGRPVPAFELPATGNRRVSLEGLKGKHVVLFFYPKDKTPGCTLEGHEFTKLHNDFKTANTEVMGVSRDTVKLHESFKECENYSIDLISDENEELCTMFGVMKNKNMYGKQVRGIERSTFVIDAEGKLVKEWRGVSVPGHAEEVLNFIKTLS